MSGQKSQQSGFTLVELLVAMTILAIGLLGIAGMQITATKESNSAHVRTAAASVAQGVLEEILARDAESPFFADAVNEPWDFDSSTIGVNPLVIDGMGTYTATYTIIRNNPIDRLARVVVSVSGQGRNVTLTGFKRVL